MSIHIFPLQQLSTVAMEPVRGSIFGHFMTTLNDTFERELAQEDEGYESRSESLSIPTPLRRAPQIYHISMSENLSFNPTTWLTTAQPHQVHLPKRFVSHSPVHCHLVFSSSDENPCENQWSMLTTHQYARWQSNPWKSRTSFASTAPYKLPAHIYTKHRWLLPGCYSRRRFSNSSTRWCHLFGRSSSR